MREERNFWRDQRGAAGLFSVLTLLALVLSIGYTIGLADATLEKMRVQDAADAAAYSGARTRGNLYQVMGFLNMAKVALYRRANGCKMTRGQAAILMELGRLSGIAVDPELLSDDVVLIGAEVAEKAYQYAVLADDLQNYIEENFVDIISNEIRVVAEKHGCELLASTPGGEPVFGDETDTYRYWWLHFAQLGQWVDFEVWGCDITRGIRDTTVEDYCVPPDWNRRLPGDPWIPRVITHAMSHERNSIKVVLQREAHENSVLPGVLRSFHTTVVGTAAAGCFSPTLESHGSNENLYTTDFRGELLTLESAKYRTWLETNEPNLANEIPWIPELTVH